MKKPWSLSTTVRNPERLRGFLKTLKDFEGKPFDNENQINYQIYLIKNRLYKPQSLNEEQKEHFNAADKVMPLPAAEMIFNNQNYVDPPLRGRNSVAPLSKIGFCIAKKSLGNVKITPLGEYFLTDDYDLSKVFLTYFLKWQLPNPTSQDFSKEDGFNIKPFIGTIHVINQVNELWKAKGNNPVGINKEEFSLFIPTLIDYKDIHKRAQQIIEYRIALSACKDHKSKKAFKRDFDIKFAKEFLNTPSVEDAKKLLSNLRDYGDNTIRYFRITKLLHIRGGGFYVDLEERRIIQINNILKYDDASPVNFKNAVEYIEYLSDLKKPQLPWETHEELNKIVEQLHINIKNKKIQLKANSLPCPDFNLQKVTTFTEEGLKKYIEQLRDYEIELHEIELVFESQTPLKIKEYIQELSNIHKSKNKKSIELERLSTLALNSLDDAIRIKPNYPMGDDYEPTFTAPGNKADIECFYEKFNAVCEVTMLKDLSQWVHEGQPVMRHLRDFEKLHNKKSAYCLFIAPSFHQDTIETFWMSIKYGYQGSKQNIIPLTIPQFVGLLSFLIELKKNEKHFTHQQLLNLYERIIQSTNEVAHSQEWINKIPEIILEWKKSILNN